MEQDISDIKVLLALMLIAYRVRPLTDAERLVFDATVKRLSLVLK